VLFPCAAGTAPGTNGPDHDDVVKSAFFDGKILPWDEKDVLYDVQGQNAEKYLVPLLK
jgi:hypothetical protein